MTTEAHTNEVEIQVQEYWRIGSLFRTRVIRDIRDKKVTVEDALSILGEIQSCNKSRKLKFRCGEVLEGIILDPRRENDSVNCPSTP